ncbi:methylated-DNA--[protein]-cysteine S-methyltransferase [Compostimonas suwonensis]|uniref:Methylated-DNA--protein-cysteine methyltransferase n=1 Tax=Compostimonas suwonensis TaxID=1048394 RepID=A0A2M9BVQ9_9MICO|nr:methylated-DNA--[protein]-cysteine S-methyltransferase [Compostimonas suwonensis]PJJ62031.1 methylated-DNA-[protein]-cysteine S-methyltransferase [Compostimonas suwonensis]
MRTAVHSIPTPVGMLLLTSDGEALTGVYFENHSHPPRGLDDAVDDAGPFAAVVEQLDEYFEGERTAFDLPLAPRGTEFQKLVWGQLARIPYGEKRSYGELAHALGSPGASRAVGLANGRNPISIIVPCHRVVGSSGSLTGYAGGLERKLWLLELERDSAPSDTATLF